MLGLRKNAFHSQVGIQYFDDVLHTSMKLLRTREWVHSPDTQTRVLGSEESCVSKM